VNDGGGGGDLGGGQKSDGQSDCSDGKSHCWFIGGKWLSGCDTCAGYVKTGEFLTTDFTTRTDKIISNKF